MAIAVYAALSSAAGAAFRPPALPATVAVRHRYPGYTGRNSSAASMSQSAR